MQARADTINTTAKTPKIDFYFDEHESALMNVQSWVGETFDTKTATELLGDLKKTLRSFRKFKRTYNNGKNEKRRSVTRRRSGV